MASSSSTGASGAAAHSDAAALIAPFISAVLNASSRGAGGASASAAAAAAAAGEGAVQNILVGVLDTIMARLNTRMDQHDAGLRQLSERIVSLEREIKERLPHVSDRPLSDALLRKGLRAVWGNETFVTPIVTLESVDYINKVLVAAGGAPFDPVAARSNPVVNNALMVRASSLSLSPSLPRPARSLARADLARAQDVAKRLGEIAKLEFSELVQRVRNSISSELEKVLTSSNVRRPPSRGIYPDIESLANNVAERCLSGGSLAKLRPTFKRELHLLRKLVATAREEGGVRIRKALANEVLAITQRSADDQGTLRACVGSMARSRRRQSARGTRSSKRASPSLSRASASRPRRARWAP
jgi:hypothetical protein